MAALPPPVVPSNFPQDTYDDDVIKVIKDEEHKGKINLRKFRKLWAARCIEVDNLPAPNLTNPIHPVFAINNFSGTLDTAQYASVSQALILASRFITDPVYLGFWVRLCTGQPVTHTQVEVEVN